MSSSDFKSFFKNRRLLIATKHQKEIVLMPLLKKELGVKCIVPENFDTDLLGTFTGEIERTEDPVTTLRKKCKTAMHLYGFDLAIASEGSFGPHPNLYFVPADDEWIILIDLKNKIEILAREISTETNYNSTAIHSEKELLEFAQKICFPSHKLILRARRKGGEKIVKDLQDIESMLETFKRLKKEFDDLSVETDMRAMNNPTRMKIIKKACENLIQDIKSCCPHCGIPGFQVKESESGLPCSLCGSPTRSILKIFKRCMQCNHSVEIKFPKGQQHEDPMYCDYCNP